MWVNAKAWGAALLGFGLVLAACGKTGTTESGETHFLTSCNSSCPGELECLCGVCSKPCDDDDSCSSLGGAATCVEHSGGTCTTVTKSCDVECGDDDACVQVSAAHTCQGGLCREPSTPSAGGSSNTGGSGGAGEGPTLGGESGVGGSTEVLLGGPACGNCTEADCATQTACSVEMACAMVKCSSAIFDETGCYRPGCVDDDGCAADERCATDPMSAETRCVEAGDSCGCSNITPTKPRRVCSPTALAGPRGDWLSIDIDDTTNTSLWTIQSDGSYVVSNRLEPGERSGHLSANDLRQLRELVNGPDVRHVLADEDLCSEPIDGPVWVILALDTTSVGREVSRCTDREGRASVSRLLELARKY